MRLQHFSDWHRAVAARFPMGDWSYAPLGDFYDNRKCSGVVPASLTENIKVKNISLDI